VLNRFERLKETLAKASQLASDLKAPKLVAYIGICINPHHTPHRGTNLQRTVRPRAIPYDQGKGEFSFLFLFIYIKQKVLDQ